MISIPGSLSFAKLVMMSSAPAKSAGMPDTRPKIHSFVDCPRQSRLQFVLLHSFCVEHNNKLVSLSCDCQISGGCRSNQLSHLEAMAKKINNLIAAL